MMAIELLNCCPFTLPHEKDTPYLFFFSIIFQTVLQGQNHDYYWPIGYASFSTVTPPLAGRSLTSMKNRRLFTGRIETIIDATVASYCDTSGTMVYYTTAARY
ncbi:MAG: hypothetical protein R2825_10955 [Saprospiraceae bacterium]